MKDDAMENMKELHPDDIEVVAGGAEINDSLGGLERLESIRRAAGLPYEDPLRPKKNTFGQQLQESQIEEAKNRIKR